MDKKLESTKKLDRVKMLKIMMEQGRKIVQDVDGQLLGHGQATYETLRLVENLEQLNKLIEMQFKLWLTEGCNDIKVAIRAVEVVSLLDAYFEDIGVSIKEPTLSGNQERRSKDEELIMLLGNLMGL